MPAKHANKRERKKGKQCLVLGLRATSDWVSNVADSQTAPVGMRSRASGVCASGNFPLLITPPQPLLSQIPEFGIVLVVVLVLGVLGFRDRKETDVLQLMGRVARG